MTDVFTKAKRSEVMAAIRSTGNRATELRMIRIMRTFRITGWRRGQILRLPWKDTVIRVRPDFLFRKRRIALFVDGEFWHAHPTRCRIPGTRTEWWTAKLTANRRRDRIQNRALRAAGWTVVRVWQHELSTPAVNRKLQNAGLP